MSWDKFEDECPGCRPALIDALTGLPMPEDHPTMLRVTHFWKTSTTRDEREAFHAMTCQNSRDPEVMTLVGEVFRRMEVAMKETVH